MRRTLGVLIGAGLALAAVGGWEWAAGPTVIGLPGADASVCFVGAVYIDPSGHRVEVCQAGDRVKYWVYDAGTGSVAGPLEPIAGPSVLVFETDGQCFTASTDGNSRAKPFAVHRVERNGTFTLVWERPDALIVAIPNQPPQAFVLSGDHGRPLRAELIDLFTGVVRHRLDFPGRTGVVWPDDTEVAAGGWAVSGDGRKLALADGWRGAERVGPPGVEVWDFETGKLLGRLHNEQAPEDQSAAELGLSDDGRELSLRFYRRDPNGGYPSMESTQVWDWAAGKRLPDRPPLIPFPPEPNADFIGGFDEGRKLWCRWSANYKRVAVLVTAADDQPVAGWKELPPEVNRPSACQPLQSFPGAVFPGATDPPAGEVWLRRRFGLPPASDRQLLIVYDCQTGRSRRLRSYPFGTNGGNLEMAYRAGRLVVAVSDHGTRRSWLEVWPTPPLLAPPVWSWPLAAMAGGLGGWRLFRPSRSRAGTASTGSS